MWNIFYLWKCVYIFMNIFGIFHIYINIFIVFGNMFGILYGNKFIILEIYLEYFILKEIIYICRNIWNTSYLKKYIYIYGNTFIFL